MKVLFAPVKPLRAIVCLQYLSITCKTTIMNNSIYPCLGIKGRIAEAADFYINTFGDGKIEEHNPIVIQIKLSGQKFMLLNDGPSSTPNVSISFMVSSADNATTEKYFNKLADGGKVMMPLDTYPWSPKYAWVQDKFGVSWQLYTGNGDDVVQKFRPSFMFTGKNAGKAKEAMEYYTKLFPESKVEGISNYEEGEGDRTDYIKHARFTLYGVSMTCMDSSADHKADFNDAISMVVTCEDQAEIDKYWNELSNNGGHEVACGWLIDKYGLAWQIIPKNIVKWVTDPVKGQRAMQAMMKMKKLIIADLENA